MHHSRRASDSLPSSGLAASCELDLAECRMSYTGETAVSDHANWKQFFQEWPAGVPRRGVLLTALNEQVTFVGFLTTDDMVLLHRNTPDNVGARKILLPYSQIAGLKLTDPLGADVFQSAGFAGELPQD